MKTIHLNKSTDNRVFYSVSGSREKGAAIINRGWFNNLKDAKLEAEKYPEYEVKRHEDKDGVRVKNEVVFCLYDFT